MKKLIKIIGAVILALALLAGGYIAGQNVQISSILSAMPKQTSADKNKPPEELPSDDGEMTEQGGEPLGEPREEEITDRAISKSDESAVDDGWSEVSSNTMADSGEVFTLYTSAEKDGDEFIWDDSQKWVLEVSDGNGGYYTLYDQLISNGNVYYEVAKRESGDEIAYVYTVTGAGMSIMQYTRTESGFAEKSVYNSGSLNRLFSNVPDYN